MEATIGNWVYVGMSLEFSPCICNIEWPRVNNMSQIITSYIYIRMRNGDRVEVGVVYRHEWV